VGLRGLLKINYPTLLGEKLTSQNCSYKSTQLLPGEYNNKSDHLSPTGNQLPEVPIATCPVDRKNQILHTSQSPGKTTSELPLATDGPKNQGKQKKKKTTKKPIQSSPSQVVQQEGQYPSAQSPECQA
jgi:hypothetical protein